MDWKRPTKRLSWRFFFIKALNGRYFSPTWNSKKKKYSKFKDLRGFPFLSYLLGWGWPDTWIGVYLTGAATHREKLKQKQYPWKSLSTILCHHYVSRGFIIFQKEVSPIFKTVVDFQGAYKCIKWHPSSFFSLGKNRGLKESNDKMTSPPNHCYWQCLKLPW